MSRVPPTPVEILIDDEWIPGTIRTCEATPDGQTCSAVVSYGNASATTTARLDASRIRSLAGRPGCPPVNQDETC